MARELFMIERTLPSRTTKRLFLHFWYGKVEEMMPGLFSAKGPTFAYISRGERYSLLDKIDGVIYQLVIFCT